jgi:tetratricopeptide (TPR) repeat protein
MEKKMKHKEVLSLLKRNEAQEVLKTATTYASKNMENLIIAVVAAIVIPVGLILFFNGRKTNEIKAQQVLSKANYFLTRPVSDQKDAQMYGMFRTKDERLEKAVMAYNEIIQTYKGTNSLPYAYLGIADAYYNNGKYKEALEYYNTFLERFPKHFLTPMALAGRAYANYEQGKYSDALADLKTGLEKYGDSYNYADMRLKSADCLVQLKDFTGAKQEYEAIIKDNGDSYWAGVAKEKLKEIKI